MEQIKEAIRTVHESLGPFLTEVIYQKALAIELKTKFETVELEKSVPIVYKDHEIAVLRADIVLSGKYILELKSTNTKLGHREESQLLRYMKILDIKDGILVNFSKTLQLKTWTL